METVKVDYSDIVATAASIVAVIAAVYARQSAQHAGRSADAAERQALAAEAALPKPPPAVEWRMERQQKNAYALRNVGTDTATGVQIIVPPEYEGLVRYELGGGTVQAGAAVQVLLISIDQYADLTEIAVAWDGQLGEVRVPVPR